MRFKLGDRFANSDGTLTCEVVEIFEEGRSALLLFSDGHREAQNYFGMMSRNHWRPLQECL